MRWIVAGALLVFGCSRSPQELESPGVPAQTVASSTAQAIVTRAPAIQAPPTMTADTTEAWNPTGIDWKSFDDGLALAKKTRKPVCLVMYGTWCEHCRNYSHVFSDPRLVERAKDFVMVRVDVDANEAISNRYKPDGAYVPRTFILDSQGNVDPSAQSGHPRYPHFFDELHADSLLIVMNDVVGRPSH